MKNNQKCLPVSLIFTDNFPNDLKFEGNELFNVYNVKNDSSAFETLETNIYTKKCLYNVILSGHNTVEDGFGLLKSFLNYNIEKEYCFDNSNYPFFLFIENEKFNKKKLYAHYIENESEIEGLEEGYEIDSKNILFSNLSLNVKEKLNSVLNYYHRKNIQVNINPYYSPYIKIMYCGVTGTGKSTLINEYNGEKIAYSSAENFLKTRAQILFKNRNYPILNQDTEGFEIGDNSQIDTVNNNIDKNEGNNFEERLHIVIYLLKNERGIDNNDILLLLKFHQMKILYYALYPKKKGLDKTLRGKANRLILDLIEKLKNNDVETKKLFKDFQDKNNLIKILNDMNNKLKERIFSANILSRKSNEKVNLLNQIKKDLLVIYDIHKNFIEKIKNFTKEKEECKIGISGDVIKQNKEDFTKILDDSPFFYKYSIDDIKRKEAEKLLNDCDVSIFWLFFYNKKVKNYRKEILNKIKNIYSDVNIEAKIDETIFSNEESWFYKTKNTKEFITQLINLFAEKYKQLELNKKYYTSCKEYNKSIELFGKYVEEYSNVKLNNKPVNFDIDFI